MRSPTHCTSCCASVGAGFSCPPSCQPIPGHCRVRQSGHFLETGSLHPPPAALRRFPRPREGQSPSPTHFFVTQHRRGERPCPPARKALLVTLRRGDPRGRPPAMHHTPWKPCHCEASANTGRGNPYPRPQSPPPFTLHATRKSHRIDPIRWLSLFHFCAEFSGRHWPFIIRTAACRASARCSAICARFTSRSALCSASRSRARFSADWARGRSMSSARSAARTSSVTSL